MDQARRRDLARQSTVLLTATYWDIGRRIVEFEQGGRERAEYGQGLIERLADDLTSRLGRGFSRQNLWQMRSFYLGWEIHTARRRDPGGPCPQLRIQASRGSGNSPDTVWRIYVGDRHGRQDSPDAVWRIPSRVAVAAMPASLLLSGSSLFHGPITSGFSP